MKNLYFNASLEKQHDSFRLVLSDEQYRSFCHNERRRKILMERVDNIIKTRWGIGENKHVKIDVLKPDSESGKRVYALLEGKPLPEDGVVDLSETVF